MIHTGFESLFDEMFNDFDDDIFAHHPMLPPHAGGPRHHELMRTDVNETDAAYELSVELPGYDKDDIKVKFDDGMLTISAAKNEDTEEHFDKNGKPRKNGRMIRHERHFGSLSRSWYVGDGIKQEGIKASYKNGILSLTVPKAEPKKELPEEQKYIAIEG